MLREVGLLLPVLALGGLLHSEVWCGFLVSFLATFDITGKKMV